MPSACRNSIPPMRPADNSTASIQQLGMQLRICAAVLTQIEQARRSMKGSNSTTSPPVSMTFASLKEYEMVAK